MNILRIAENARTDVLARGDFWRSAGPFRLVSLWDMLRVYSDDFYTITTSLRLQIEDATSQWRRYGNSETTVAEYLQAGNESWEKVRPFLDRLEAVCRKLELDMAVFKIEHMIGMNLTINPDYFTFLTGDLSELKTMIGKQFPDRMLMYVPCQDAPYLNEKLFGENVYDRFPKSRDDIANAGRCLASGSADGAVYYLMRVLEPALKRLAKSLGLSTKGMSAMQWGEILRLINDAVMKVKNKTPRQQRYSEIAAHLRHCKNAWRDPVSHARKQFTKEEAIATFEHVKIFVNNLVRNT